MSAVWIATMASNVRAGDRIRARGIELTVTRIDEDFFGVVGLRGFVEDSDEQWIKVPVQADAEVEVKSA